MKDGIRNQLKGLEVERKRLETLMSADPGWIAYCDWVNESEYSSAGQPESLEQDLPDGLVEPLRDNRLFRAWKNLVAASDSLRELLDPEDLEPDQTIGGLAQTEADKLEDPKRTQAGAEQPRPGKEAFRTKLVLKSESAPAVAQHQLVEAATGRSTEVQSEDSLSVPEQKISSARGPSTMADDGVQRAMTAHLSRRAANASQLTSQLAAGPQSVSTDADMNEHAATEADQQPQRPMLVVDNTAREGSEADTISQVELTVDPSNPDQLEDNTGQGPDELSWIAGVGPDDEVALYTAGLTSFADIATMTAEQVRELRRALSRPQRISRQQWIEQAAMLAAGHQTTFVRRSGHRLEDSLVGRPDNEVWHAQALPIPPAPVIQPEEEQKLEPESGLAEVEGDVIETATQDASAVVTLAPLASTTSDTESAPEDSASLPPVEFEAELEGDRGEEIVPDGATAVSGTGKDELAGDDAPDHELNEQSSDVAPERSPKAVQVENLALCQRMERFERTRTEVSLPDLRRPEPFESEESLDTRGRTNMATAPPPPPSTIEPPSLPDPQPALDDVKSRAPDADATDGLKLTEFRWSDSVDDAGWDEAAVEIVTVTQADEGPSKPIMTVPPRGEQLNGATVSRDQVEEPKSDDPTPNDPTPYELAQRMERLARSPVEQDDNFIRFNGEIEEASVQIIRSQPKPDDHQEPEPEPPTKPRRSSGPTERPQQPASEPVVKSSSSSSRRFLDALTGARKAR